MNRKFLINLLNKYKPDYSEELVYKKQMLEFINFHSNCFDRDCELGHITASSFLLNCQEDQALLMHHAKLDIWVQLGGHCDGDHDVLSVAIKEAKEESGIEDIIPISENIYDLDIHLIPSNKKDKSHYHYDIRFLLKVGTAEYQVNQNSEAKELKWFPINTRNLPTDNKSVLRLFEKMDINNSTN